LVAEEDTNMFFTKLIAAVILPCVNRTHDQSFSFLFQVEMTMHTARKNQLEWSNHTLLGLGKVKSVIMLIPALPFQKYLNSLQITMVGSNM